MPILTGAGANPERVHLHQVRVPHPARAAACSQLSNSGTMPADPGAMWATPFEVVVVRPPVDVSGVSFAIGHPLFFVDSADFAADPLHLCLAVEVSSAGDHGRLDLAAANDVLHSVNRLVELTYNFAERGNRRRQVHCNPFPVKYAPNYSLRRTADKAVRLRREGKWTQNLAKQPVFPWELAI